jgi:hypothetical protein
LLQQEAAENHLGCPKKINHFGISVDRKILFYQVKKEQNIRAQQKKIVIATTDKEDPDMCIDMEKS